MIIKKFPEKTSIKHIMPFFKTMQSIPREEPVCIDFESMQHIVPIGLLLASSIINKIKTERELKFINYDSNSLRYQDGRKMAAYYGFFKSIGLDFGNDYCVYPDIETHDSYMKITQINFSTIKAMAKEQIELPQQIIEKISFNLATILLGGKTEHDKNMEFVFREIIRNSYEHSRSTSVWLCAQYWRNSRLATIAILDNGIGIYNSLKENARISISDKVHAIKLSTIPGISRNIFRFEDLEHIENEWQNTGFGLYMITKLAQDIGNMSIVSSECSLSAGRIISKPGDPFAIYNDVPFGGTAISFTIELDKIGQIPSLMKKYLWESGPIHDFLKKSGVPSASTVVKMIRPSGSA